MRRPIFKFNEFQEEFALSAELPYWDFIDQNDEECAVLADGSIVRGFKLTGIDLEAMDSEQINRFTIQIRSVLNSLPDSVELQFLVDVNSDYDEIITKHESLKGSRPLVSWISEGRVFALKSEATAQGLIKPNIYLFIYLRVQTEKGVLASFFKSPSNFSQLKKEAHLKRALELNQISTSVKSNLESSGIRSEQMKNREIESLIYRVLNPTRSQSYDSPLLGKIHREQTFTPDELNEIPELSIPSPREQLAFSDVIQGIDSFFLDGYYHRILTLKTCPEFTHSALISRLMALPFPHLLSVQVRVPEQSRELASLHTKRRMAHSMTATQGGRATDLESEAKLHSTEELLRELINTGQKIFYFQLAILLKARSADDLEHQTKTILSRFREMNGAEGLAETVAGFKLFKTVLPAGNTLSVRTKRVKTDNLADFLPIYQPWEGDATPICLFRNRRGGLVSYNPFDPDLPNYNTLVTGSSGSGKSFLNNCILLQYLTQDPLTYIIDIGGSYRKLCEAMGGQYIEMVPTKDGVSQQAINPFLLPAGATEAAPEKIKFLIGLFETIFTDDDGDKLRKIDKSLLEEAIVNTYTQCLPNRMPRLSDFANTLESATGEHAQSLRDFAKMLYPWTGTRPYGRLLDTESSFDLNSDLVVFDLKGLSNYPDLMAVMVLIVTDFILGKVESVPNKRKRILMDESWAFLKSRGASEFMEYCVRTLRKSGSGITFITQGLEEIEQSQIGAAILNNTATKFILFQQGDLEPIRKTLKFNDQEMALISSLSQKKGSYSEAFLIANGRRTVIRVVPTPLEYWLSTSDAADQSLLDQARLRMKDQELPLILLWLSKHFPKGSQGTTQLSADKFLAAVQYKH